MELWEYGRLRGNGAKQEAVIALLFEIRDLLRAANPKLPKELQPKPEPPPPPPPPPPPKEDPLLDTAPVVKPKAEVKSVKQKELTSKKRVVPRSRRRK